VLAGLRRQGEIPKCKAWTDPIDTKSVRGKGLAKRASTPTAESSGQASGRCRSGARSVTPRAKSTWRGTPLTPRIRSQPNSRRPQFQNRPLKVFGEHDHATVAQMRNCMSVGNVVAGVVCADGHLGYAQPVGGVIAYEKQISISGVGFDIGCGNMAIRLDTPFNAVEDRVGTIIKDVSRTISFGVGRTK